MSNVIRRPDLASDTFAPKVPNLAVDHPLELDAQAPGRGSSAHRNVPLAVATLPNKEDGGDLTTAAREAALREAFEEARRQGHEAGLGRGRELAAQEAHRHAKETRELLQGLQQLRGQLLASLEEEIVTLVFEATTKILGQAAVDQALMRAIILQALQQLSQKPLSVHVGPADHALLCRLARDDSQGFPQGLALQIDAALRPGDCRLETRAGGLDAGLETQLRRFMQELVACYGRERERGA